MNVLDLFSGIGGFSLGLERAGMRTVAFCEIDPVCRRVLAKHWPNVPIFDDIKEVKAQDVARLRPSVICGGFPCQDISAAGRKAGIEGKRSGLWKEYSRIIGELRPDFVIVENVAALLGRGMDVVLGDLSDLGYDAEWETISASDMGAPHDRKRIWIVSYPTGQGRSGILRDLFQFSAEPHPQWAAIALDTRRAAEIREGRRQRVGESPFFGSSDGLPRTVDELKQFGNSVVPQIPEIIGRAIMSAAMSMTERGSK